jgi:branched-chain amino acid transport system substrate-binding protein
VNNKVVGRGGARGRLRPISGVAALGLAAGLLGACGSSGSSASTSNATLSNANGSSKSSIVIGSTGPLSSPIASFPEVKSAEEAAVDGINASGGILGHKVKLDFCDGKFTVNGELGCFRTLTTDKVAAIVGPLLIASTGIPEYEIAQQSGTAVVGSPAYQPGELQSPVSFPLGAGVPGASYGAVAALLARGDRKIAIFGDANNPAATTFAAFCTQALKAAGLQPVRTVVGNTSSDPTLQATAAKAIEGGVDGILITGAPPSMSKAVPALRSQGYKGAISTVDGALPEPVVKAIGSAGNGMLVTSQSAFADDSQNPAVAKYQAEMKKYAPGAALDSFSIQAWSAVQLFAAVVEQTKATTKAAVLAAFKGLDTPVSVGTIGPYKVVGVTSPITKGYEAAPRIFNQTVQMGTVEDDQFKASGGLVDPFTMLASGK